MPDAIAEEIVRPGQGGDAKRSQSSECSISQGAGLAGNGQPKLAARVPPSWTRHRKRRALIRGHYQLLMAARSGDHDSCHLFKIGYLRVDRLPNCCDLADKWLRTAAYWSSISGVLGLRFW